MIGILLSAAVLQGCNKAAAAGVDTAMQSRIENALSHAAPSWTVQTLLHSSTGTGRMLELTREDQRVTVLVQYMRSSKDAARSLRCQLLMIQVPRYSALPGLGDEAYVLTKAHVRLRIDRVELSIDSRDGSLEVERAVAERVIAAIRP